MTDEQRKLEKLRRQLELQHKKLRHIFSIGRESVAILGSQKPEQLDAILQVIADETAELLDSEVASILLIDPKTDLMTIRAAAGISEDVIRKTKIKVGERISGWVAKHKKGLLVLDIEKNPFFVKRNQEKYYTKSLISAPIKINHTVFGVINVNNKHSRRSFEADDLDLLQALADHTALIIRNFDLYKELQELYMKTVQALTEAIDVKDHYTKKHSENVTEYASAIAREMGLSHKKREIVINAAKLHDIGKIGVHDYILTKTGKLTPEEWGEMKSHSLKGVKILEPLTFLSDVVEVIKHHHEHYDGSGYPDGQKGDEISVEAKIMSVADAYDAMTTKRAYAAAMTKEKAIEDLKRQSGKQFDPAVVRAFLKVLKRSKDNNL